MNTAKGPEPAPGPNAIRPPAGVPGLCPLLLLLGLAVAGCGQKGPLYLPDERGDPRTGSPPAAAAEQEEAQEDPDLEEEADPEEDANPEARQ